MKAYAAHGWRSEGELPQIAIPDGFFKPYNPEGVYPIDPEIHEWIANSFKSATRKTVELIARVTTVEGFESLKPILYASLQDREFKETTEFKNNGTTPAPVEGGNN
jgi:hypothetical protein